MFARGLPMEPLIGSSPTNYDATKFSWVGSATDELSVCATWHTTGIKTWDDLMSKPLTVAGEGTGADPDIYAIVIKNVFDAKLRLVSGYPGAAEMSLAIERGEVDGRCGWSWSTIKSLKPEWIKDKKLNIIVQLSEKKSAELPDVPTVMEYADSERHRQILRLITSRQIMGRLFAAPPGLPADRKAALRRAFDETMKDPEFLAEAKAAKLEVNPISGEELDKLIGELYQTPPDVIEEARVVIAKGAR
jgi:tripartite-type tricarboxylate transporter receptor subunit TctC